MIEIGGSRSPVPDVIAWLQAFQRHAPATSLRGTQVMLEASGCPRIRYRGGSGEDDPEVGRHRCTGVPRAALVAAVVLYILGGSRLNRRHQVAAESIAIPVDEAAIARGRHLAEAITLCTACHGEDLGGQPLLDEPMIATIYASNLTAGRGGVGSVYEDLDYVKAIRHGINREGRGLMIMHSDAYQKLSAADLGAIIAWVKSLPAVDNVVPRTQGGVLGRILVQLGAFDSEVMPLIPAEIIDHTAPFANAPLEGVSAEYGRYLVAIGLCAMCHGANLNGGPPIEEGAPPAPSLLGYSSRGTFSAGQFIATLRTGVTPSGRSLDAESMPWEVYARMSDDELLAIREISRIPGHRVGLRGLANRIRAM